MFRFICGEYALKDPHHQNIEIYTERLDKLMPEDCDEIVLNDVFYSHDEIHQWAQSQGLPIIGGNPLMSGMRRAQTYGEQFHVNYRKMCTVERA